MIKENLVQSALKALKMNTRVFGVKMDGHAGMTKREQELRQKVSNLKDEATDLMAEGKQSEAKAKIDEAKAAKTELENFLAMMETFNAIELPGVENRGGQMNSHEPEDNNEEYTPLFLKALRGKSLTSDEVEIVNNFQAGPINNAMKGDEPEDGGLIVPQDIQTRINQYKRQFESLEQYVRVVPVSTRSGSRVLEKNAEMAPLENITNEMDPINTMAGSKFENLNYEISDYAGILPISNTLLADTDQNLMDHLAEWAAKKSIVTRNFLILQKLNALTKKAISDIDSIKNVMNVDLDPAISRTSIVLTNQSGFNYLDKLKNDKGEYILQKDPTNATRRLLFGIHPVVVLSNRFLADSEGKAPIFFGDLKEAIAMFDRQKYSIKTTDVGGDAFKRNTIDMRLIEREQVKMWDGEAVVAGEITVEEIPEA